nr:T9SS type A sorting domain-containing protein [Bacteroidota bacterium]
MQSESVMDGTLEIYNSNGAILYDSKIKGHRYFAIDMQSWKNGLYVVQFINGKNRYVKKVVKI